MPTADSVAATRCHALADRPSHLLCNTPSPHRRAPGWYAVTPRQTRGLPFAACATLTSTGASTCASTNTETGEPRRAQTAGRVRAVSHPAPPRTVRAWRVWRCVDRGWMSVAAAALRWMRTGAGGGQASTSPHGGASGAAPSLTPRPPTAFLRSCPSVAGEADRPCERPRITWDRSPARFRARSCRPCRSAGSAGRTQRPRCGCRRPGGLHGMRYPFPGD